MGRLIVIDLTNYEADCTICDAHICVPQSAPSFAIARYEDLVVPDDYRGEWGGAPVCETCYWIERGMHAKWPDLFLTFKQIRDVRRIPCPIA